MFNNFKKLKADWDKSVIRAKRFQELAKPINDENSGRINQCTNVKNMYKIADKEVEKILNSEVSSEEIQIYNNNNKRFVSFILTIITIIVIFIIYLFVY